MAIAPTFEVAEFVLTRPAGEDAAKVADWVQGDQELFWLAPATPPPLTAQKVQAWTGPHDMPLVLRRRDKKNPLGYAELNRMPGFRRELWIGHFLVRPALRGQGIGHAFMQHLLRLAFERRGASSVSLIVFPENQAAVRCYLKSGLSEDGLQLRCFEHLPGRFKMMKMRISRRNYRRTRAHVGPLPEPFPAARSF